MLSQLAFERYEALYEKILYTTSDVEMLGHEHEQRARRAVYEAIIAECSHASTRSTEGLKVRDSQMNLKP